MKILFVFLMIVLSGCQFTTNIKTPFFCSSSETKGLKLNDKSYLMAHKGGFTKTLAPNSLQTMSVSRKKGLFLYEIDVRRTLDGVFILSHDDDLSIDTQCEGSISNLNYVQISNCKHKKDGSKIEKLTSVLAWANENEIIWLDLKEKFEPKKIISMLSPFIKNKNIVIGLYYKDLESVYSKFSKQPVFAIPVSSEEDFKRPLENGIKKRT